MTPLRLLLPLGVLLVSLAYASFPAGTPWRVSGVAMTSCSCRTPCPCRSNLPPAPEPFCESTEFARFESGHYGDTSLNGAEFAIVQRTFTWDGWHLLYLDSANSKAHNAPLIRLRSNWVSTTSRRFVLHRFVLRLPKTICATRFPFPASSR